jgi:hypothetical protein
LTREGRRSAPGAPWLESFYDLPLRKPADGVTPAGEAYTYTANDMSVGDVDGDGRYEFVVKWDPSNSKDVSQRAYTGNTVLDTYAFDGTLLWRYLSTESTDRKLCTLMHDPQYRADVARQQTGCRNAGRCSGFQAGGEGPCGSAR